MSLPSILIKPRQLRSSSKPKCISSKDRHDLIGMFTSGTFIEPIEQSFILASSPPKINKIRPLSKLFQRSRTEIDHEIEEKINKYKKIYFGPSNCAKSLRLQQVQREKLVKPVVIIGRVKKEGIRRKEKRRGSEIRAVGLGFLYDTNWGNFN